MQNSISSHQNRKKFLDTVNEIREILGYKFINNEPDFNEEIVMEMNYGDFEFSLVHSIHRNTNLICIECIFGEIPDSNKILIHNKLLCINYMLSEVDSSGFCIDSKTNQLIYIIYLNLIDQNGELILKKMTEIVWYARRWLETFYLNDSGHSNYVEKPFELA